MSDISDTRIIAFPGINIVRLTNKIQSRNVDIAAKHLILHVGTNDINSLDGGAILSCYNNLISVIRQISSVNILISGILPRPLDWHKNNDKVKFVNKKLVQLCKDRGVRFLHTYKYFLHAGTPKRELFAVRDGGLHLNLEGTRVLRSFFINVVAHL